MPRASMGCSLGFQRYPDMMAVCHPPPLRSVRFVCLISFVWPRKRQQSRVHIKSPPPKKYFKAFFYQGACYMVEILLLRRSCEACQASFLFIRRSKIQADLMLERALNNLGSCVRICSSNGKSNPKP